VFSSPQGLSVTVELFGGVGMRACR
jgi:hypothetical protein